MEEMENKKEEEDQKEEGREGKDKDTDTDKDKDKRHLNIPSQILLLQASQRPLIRKIPILTRRDTPISIQTRRDIHDMVPIQTRRDTHDMGNGTDMDKHAHNPRTQGNHAHNPRTQDAQNPRPHAIVLGLEQPPLRKLKAR